MKLNLNPKSPLRENYELLYGKINEAVTYKKFEVGKSYSGTAVQGGDLKIKIISRTDKTAVIDSHAFGKTRVKIRDFHQDAETISYKAWFFSANDIV